MSDEEPPRDDSYSSVADPDGQEVQDSVEVPPTEDMSSSYNSICMKHI